MAAATKKRKEEAYPWMASASSWHITHLKQSILETFDIYALIPRISDGQYFSLSATTFHPSDKLTIYHNSCPTKFMPAISLTTFNTLFRID
jgi:hypothetical protein